LDETLHARHDFNDFMCVLKYFHEKFGVRYLAQTRADAIVMNPDSLHEMKAAGIYSLIIGAESASDSVLAEMNKMTLYENVPRALEIIKDKGIETVTTWLIGHPGSSYSEEMKTKEALEYLLAAGLTDHAEVYTFVPYPGTISSLDTRLHITETDFSEFGRMNKPVYDLDGFPRDEIECAYQELLAVIEMHGKRNAEVLII